MVIRFAVGDRVWYVIPRGPGRDRPLYAESTVVSLWPTRITITTALDWRRRAVAPSACTQGDPPPGVDIIRYVDWRDSTRVI